jgi:hypothetical protein
MSKVCVPSVFALVCGSGALAGGGAANNPHLRFSQEHHWTFSEIGDVGNAPHVIPSGSPSIPPTKIGRVDHRYRIATTEVTWGQYFEFVEAHAPTLPQNLRSNIAGRNLLNPHGVASPSPITFVGLQGGVPRYTFDESWADRPAEASWRNYARFVNWLHNGAPSAVNAAASDFERGAYDTSTFDRVQGPSGIYYFTDQDSRSEGARFWIPSLDELTKAAFYDPNRYGEGQGGYWEYPTSSDTAPIAGDPALGGQTNAGPRTRDLMTGPRASSGRWMWAVTPTPSRHGACSTRWAAGWRSPRPGPIRTRSCSRPGTSASWAGSTRRSFRANSETLAELTRMALSPCASLPLFHHRAARPCWRSARSSPRGGDGDPAPSPVHRR